MLTNMATQKVVIVNGSREALGLLETVLDAGRYDIVFVESSENAYSQVKRVQPDLVILYIPLDDLHGFQVLTMLKLDEATQNIPLLTYTTQYEGQDDEEDALEATGAETFAPKSAVWMN